jgi:hypothetical protein
MLAGNNNPADSILDGLHEHLDHDPVVGIHGL